MTHDPRAALLAWRQATGYSQTEVGVLFGVTKSGVGQWERGRVAVPARVCARLRAERWLSAPKRGPWRPLNHDPLCPPGTCKSCGKRRAWADPAHRRPHRQNAWESEHDAWLVTHAGAAPYAELARRLTAAYGQPRTPGAVRVRMGVLGLSRQVALLTAKQVAYYLGVSDATVIHWVQRGWFALPAWAYQRHPRGGPYAISPEAVEACIALRAWRLDPAQMPASRYQHLAAAIWARERWLTTPQAARYAGVSPLTVCRWVRVGHLHATRRPMPRGHYRLLIRARDLTTWLRTREQRGAA